MNIIKKILKKILYIFGYNIYKQPDIVSAKSIRALKNSQHNNTQVGLPLSFFENGIIRKINNYKEKLFLISIFKIDKNGYLQIKSDLNKDQSKELNQIFYNNKIQIEKNKIVFHNENQDYTFYDKIHYGCGTSYFENWINVDLYDKSNVVYNQFEKNEKQNYLQMNLTEKHFFTNDLFEFGFSEDFLEHLRQEDSIIFLMECFRTFKRGGVLRLSFPGLENVLLKHYRKDEKNRAYIGKFEAYSAWDHIHFYSKEEIETVSKHIGFSEIEFKSFGESEHKELRGIDRRIEQKNLNIYVELTK